MKTAVIQFPGSNCDGDALLIQVEQVGGACHTGDHSCFDRHEALPQEDRSRPWPERIGKIMVQTSACTATFTLAAAVEAFEYWNQQQFMAFALAPAANVRTLALVEVPLAQIASRRIFSEGTSWRELLGMAMIVGGVGALLLLAI